MAAGTYEIPRWTVNGGGGTSTGSTFAVSGTLGQPEAGPLLSGSRFSLVSGFWGLPRFYMPQRDPITAWSVSQAGQLPSGRIIA